jgi:hypothetical protein
MLANIVRPARHHGLSRLWLSPQNAGGDTRVFCLLRQFGDDARHEVMHFVAKVLAQESSLVVVAASNRGGGPNRLTIVLIPDHLYTDESCVVFA